MNSKKGYPLSGAIPERMFVERLWPSIGVILFELLMTVSLGIAYARAYGIAIGVIVGAVASVIVAITTLLTVKTIWIDRNGIQVGKAQLPFAYIGDVTPLSKSQTRESLHNHAHRLGYYVLKPWIAESVVIEVTDTEDPHPFWQISTRNPHRLSETLKQANESSRGKHGS